MIWSYLSQKVNIYPRSLNYEKTSSLYLEGKNTPFSGS